MNQHLLLVLLTLASTDAVAARYEYVNRAVAEEYEMGTESFVLDTDERLLISADSLEEVRICGPESGFHCFHNLAEQFYVPRSELKIGQVWECEGREYRVLRVETFRALGVSHEVWVIRAHRADRKDYFYYSTGVGLLAIKHVYLNKQRPQFFVLTSAKGFPD